MKTRPATNEEIINKYASFNRVSFHTPVMETLDRRTETGVRHIKRGNSKLRIIDNIPFVKRHGKLEKLHGTMYLMDSGTEFVANLTILEKF